LDGNTYPGLSTWQLKMLMKWAKSDPVSEKEISRNNAVFGIQNNRNPFIDYPGLEDYIWGEKKDVAFSYDHYNSEFTAIREIASSSTDVSRSYTIDGRKANVAHRTQLSKGIYIVNGKKVFVR
jgi:hypothetical protein